MTVRIYGKIVNEWKAEDEKGREYIMQQEWTYTDYNSETGEIIGTGTEDIQKAFGYNYKHRMDHRTIYTWNGRYYEKSGRKAYSEAKTIRFRPGTDDKRATVNAIGKLARIWYEGKEIQVRAY